MTTLAALFAALPLMLGWGEGHELRRPLGLAIFGGLIVSQLLTLFTTPVIYLAFDRLGRRFSKAPARAPRSARSHVVAGRTRAREPIQASPVSPTRSQGLTAHPPGARGSDRAGPGRSQRSKEESRGSRVGGHERSRHRARGPAPRAAR